MLKLSAMFIGIDLGTSNSVIYGVVPTESGGEPRLFKTADGADALPSVIYLDKRGTRLHGRRAQEQALLSPDSVAHGFKRLLGSKTPIEIESNGETVKLSAEECSADIIKTLLEQARVESGQDSFETVVITIPAAFNQMQSEATLRAAERAGLSPEPHLLQEPVAAAIAAAHEGGIKGNGRFLIYDLGGGTFDLALAKVDHEEIKIVANQGINMLGGRDFDRRLVQDVIRPWLIENFDLPDDFMRQPAYRRLLRVAQLAAEKAKIDLSSRDVATIFAADEEVRTEDTSGADIFLDIKLTRETFEGLIADTVARTVAVTQQLLQSQDLKAGDIDRLVFIGGPSKIPLIRARVADELGIAADLSLDPMTTVARGAALYAAQLGGQPVVATVGHTGEAPAAGEQPEMAAALPAVRINAAKTIAVKTRDGDHNILLPLLEAGTPLPAEGSLEVTAVDGLGGDNAAAALSFELFQLEFPERLELNLCIGAFRITAADLPDGASVKAGDKIDFRWMMNASGIMRASVVVTANGQELELSTPRFYAPQEGEQSFAGAAAQQLAGEVMRAAWVELDDIGAAAGPLYGMGGMGGSGPLRDADLLRHRLREQETALQEAGDVSSQEGAEQIRLASEEARFIRQDLARLTRKFGGPVLQRRLGRLSAAYNRSAQAYATPEETTQVAQLTGSLNEIIRTADAVTGIDASSWHRAERDLLGLRRLFYAAAARDLTYLQRWHDEIRGEPHLYPDQDEYKTLLAETDKARAANDEAGFRAAMQPLLTARITLTASSSASELATIEQL